MNVDSATGLRANVEASVDAESLALEASARSLAHMCEGAPAARTQLESAYIHVAPLRRLARWRMPYRPLFIDHSHKPPLKRTQPLENRAGIPTWACKASARAHH